MSATKVQATTGSCAAASGTTITLNGVVAHNCLILKVSYIDVTQASAASPATPTDSNGTVSVARKPNCVFPGPGAGACGAFIIYVQDCAAGTHTFTVNPFGNATALYANLSLEEWSGLASAPLDQATSNDIASAASTTTGNTGTTAALAQSSELVHAALCIFCGSGLANAGISTPASSGYTSLLVAQDTGAGVGAEQSYKEAGSTSGQIATWTWTSDSTMLSVQMCIAAFLEASAVATVAWAPRQTFHPGRSPGLPPQSARFYQTPKATNAAAAGNVTLALTGQTATFSLGTITPTITYSLTGQTATFTEGTSLLNVSYGLTAQTATFTEGTITNGGIALSLTGQTATFTEGVIAPSVSYGLTAQTATFTEGALSSSVSYALTGQTATFTEGVIAPNVSYGLTGQTAAFTEGTITATQGGDVTVTLSGQTATFSLGTITPLISYGLTGQSATFSEGTPATNVSYSVGAQTATFILGTIVAAGGDVPLPVSGGTAIGGGGGHRGSNAKEILRLRKKDEEFTEELRSIYKAIVRRGQPELVEKAQEIVWAATPKVDASNRVSIAELPPDRQDEEIQQLTALKTDLEIALRLVHAEVELEEENMQLINIILQVI